MEIHIAGICDTCVVSMSKHFKGYCLNFFLSFFIFLFLLNNQAHTIYLVFQKYLTKKKTKSE